MLYGPNTNNGSIIYMLECQAEYAVQAVEWMERDDLAWIDVKPDVEAEYNDAAPTRPRHRGRVGRGQLPQLLPRRRGPHRHAVAAQHERVPPPHRAARPRRLPHARQRSSLNTDTAFSRRNFGHTWSRNGTSGSSEKIRSSERPIG